MKTYNIFFILLLLLSIEVNPQSPKKSSSEEIYQSIQKLKFLGTVLYVAAHPDDENTRLISYFSNHIHARTAYLSLTRGGGGQNLIGPEIRELLGVIRTNELLQARKIDGGNQFFTRANDFGYSKNPEETLKFWNEEEILSDMVKVIREFQPDVIVNRFDIESAGKTHGHHTSSAILSSKAFDLAADANYRLNNSQAWKSNRLFFNTSWWFYGSKENFEKADKSKMLSVDTGVYFPSSGLSNTEISSLSRSKHKSQGFGSTGSRGSQMEYLELIKGNMPENKNVFDGIDTSWNRVEGGTDIKEILDGVERNFDFNDPSSSVSELVKAYSLIKKIDDDYWREFKTDQIIEIIAACMGLYLEAISDNPNATPGDEIKINLEVINRSDQKIILDSYSISNGFNSKEVQTSSSLENNKRLNFKNSLLLPLKSPFSSPYWLIEEGSLGMYKVLNNDLIGKPVANTNNYVFFNVSINGIIIPFKRNIKYKFNDPVKGEVYQPFEIVPEVSSKITSNVILFNEDSPKEIPVIVTAHKDDVQGIIKMKIPMGWQVSPVEIPFKILKKDEEISKIFIITPTKEQNEGFVEPIIESNGNTYTKSMIGINYGHIPKQTVLLPAKAKVVRLDLVKKGNTIGYIKGAGDEVPKYLQQIGYKVTVIDPKTISKNSLGKFDAVIMGIRAYNTLEILKIKQNFILEYVKNGGNLIVQYNTSRRLLVKENLAPYKLQLSRDRVTEEDAMVTFLNPDHEMFNYPNKITKDDFEGWVQERGLYFPDEWANEFTPLLSMHDKGESPKKGSLLVAKYGKGNYIYTGLSFFRELPAGVPGAYKLFANMISLGKNDLEKEIKK